MFCGAGPRYSPESQGSWEGHAYKEGILRVRKSLLLVPFVLLAAALLLRNRGGARSEANTTLVFGTASDPVVLDGPLVSDGESLRPIDQIFEGLVGLKPGTTKLIPALALSWKAAKGGLSWTFTLRKDVKFQDGTTFNAAAVCINFSRWYNFPAPLQSDAVSYYWNTVFGGFAHPAPGNPGPDKSLYKGCKANGASQGHDPPDPPVVVVHRRARADELRHREPDGAEEVPGGRRHGRRERRLPSDAAPSGRSIRSEPARTCSSRGPSATSSCSTANPHYWGKKPKIGTIIFKPISDNAARLQALQTGEIQGTTSSIRPTSARAVEQQDEDPEPPGVQRRLRRDQPEVQAVRQPARPPGARVRPRPQLGRQGLLRRPRSGCESVPAAARHRLCDEGRAELLVQPGQGEAVAPAGGRLKLPLAVDFWYPTSVSRPYMPNPQQNAEAFGASLRTVGFKVTFHAAPWRPDYLGAVQSGKAELYLLGWTGDFGDPANFLNVHFGAAERHVRVQQPGALQPVAEG